MASPRMCPSCGRTEPQAEFAGAFCTDCATKRARITIPNLALVRCSSCGRYRITEWRDMTPDGLGEWAASKLRSPHALSGFAFDVREYKNAVRVRMTFNASVDGKPLPQSRSTYVPVERTLCVDCSRRTGGYYEAIIQFRGNPDVTKKWVQHAAKRINAESFIPKTVEKKEGVDVYVGSRATALKALADLDQHYTVSRKLSGRREGHNIYRWTYCVRAE